MQAIDYSEPEILQSFFLTRINAMLNKLTGRLTRKIERLKRLCKDIGFKRFLKNIFYKSHEEILIGSETNKSANSFNHKLELKKIEESQRAELHKFYTSSGSDELYPESRIENYFSCNFKCFVATREDRIIGHFWWGDNQSTFKRCDPALRYVGNTFNLKDDDALAIDFFIIPEERGQGTVLEFFTKALMSLHDLGYSRCLGLVMPDNIGARWTYKLLGHIDYKRIKVHRLLNYIVVIGSRIYISPPFLGW